MIILMNDMQVSGRRAKTWMMEMFLWHLDRFVFSRWAATTHADESVRGNP